ncbi:MAG: hypothetical protein K2W95_21145 [Candidatus Obscuribacterales bacterium]|nr:hypothetical protein [Candidatus Obscuribacterales bacterium]
MKSKVGKAQIPSLLSSSDSRSRRLRTGALGLTHESCRPSDPRPGDVVEIHVLAGVNEDVASLRLRYTVDGGDPLQQSDRVIEVDMPSMEVSWDTSMWGYCESFRGVIPGQTEGTLVRYVIVAQRTDGAEVFVPVLNRSDPAFARVNDAVDHARIYHTYRRGEPMVHQYYVDKLTIPDWLHDAIIYQIVPDRFATTNGGSVKVNRIDGLGNGTLRGLIGELDYITDLGANCLWLTPISPSPSHHGYDCTDFGAIEPRLGTEQDWDDLVAGCKQRNIRILLDLAANHVSNQHPLFREAVADENSPYRKWFRFTNWPDYYDSYAMLSTFPILETENEEVRSHIIDHCCRWLKRGCDGFRLDHAHGLSHAFWSEFRKHTRSVAPESVLVGEVSHPPDGLLSFEGRMDGVLDFRLCELFRLLLVDSSITPSEFDRQVSRHLRYLEGRMVNPSFFDNHDMNRLLFIVGGDMRKVKLAALLQFTLPGPPIIYYGNEIGLSQQKGVGRLEEARLPFPRDAINIEMLQYYKDLVALRKSGLRIWQQERKLVQADEAVYACLVGDRFMVAINNSGTQQFVVVPMAQSGAVVLCTQTGVELCGDALKLPAYCGAVLKFGA